MPNISLSVQWAINVCNDPNVGYSQAYRNQQTVDGITYYDCSSFIWYALKAGGFNLTGYPFTTATMRETMENMGFNQLPISTTLWMPGDIVWRSGHVEMVHHANGVGDGYTMGAHSSSFPLADQVSINTTPDSQHTRRFTELYRFGGVAPTREWYRDPNNHGSLTDEQAKNNALCLRDWFVANTDWSLQAIAGLAANVEGESDFNPESMERPNSPIGVPGQDGIGLVQWTTVSASEGNPLFLVLQYLYGSSTDWGDPIKQCSAIKAEYQKSIGTIPSPTTPDFDPGWYQTSSYPLSWNDWAHSTQDPGYLALAFQANYERPAALDPNRETWGRKWYNYYLDNPYSPSPFPPIRSKRGLKIWQMIRYF